MEIQALINRQRVKHIVDSYCLQGNEAETFELHLNELLSQYPSSTLELALIEVLVDGWSDMPMERGLSYLYKVRDRLQQWQLTGRDGRLTPAKFEQITGLDAAFVFSEAPSCLLKPPLAPPQIVTETP
ncbi:MAG: hypothetical protein AAFR42_01005 [Cyanobacteria bacterium J06628_6]